MNIYPNPHPDHCPWHSYAEKWGASNIKWCEENVCSFISEPANTWSNLAYFVAFLFMLKLLQKNRNLELSWLAFTMLLIGSSSFFYHMSNFYISQLFDFIGMYSFLFWYFCLNLKHLNLVKFKNMVVLYISLILLFTIATHIGYFTEFRFQLLIVIAGLMIGVSEFFLLRKQPRNPTSFKYLYIGIGVIILAEAFSFSDLIRVLCFPSNHFFQGHSIWHLLSAVGLYYIFKHQSLRYPNSHKGS